MDGAILWLEKVRGQDAVVEGTRAVLDELIDHIRTIRPDPNAPKNPNLPEVANSNAGRGDSHVAICLEKSMSDPETT